MIEYFYKITKIEAALIGKFDYDNNSSFDPFVGEQIDGNYIISEKMYELLKNTKQFQRVDFTGKVKISSANLDTKKIIL